ncbi:thioesterase II family protein [Streptomyces sp. P1-3]|uniref:thioesterase II family protein n=1 Tax=Streptomyces sp. P1-3 TaxID=3421658 RepID=UPI003D3621EA
MSSDHLGSRPDTWLLPLPAKPDARLRLYCFPHAGGGIAPYARWAAGLPHAVEVVGVQLPGRENRIGEPFAIRVQDIADPLCEALARHHPHLPFAFFGHCAGALLAYECAQALNRAQTRLPVALLASAAPAPSRWDGPRMMYGLDETDPLEAYRRLGGIPSDVADDPELAELIRDILRADARLYGGHTSAAVHPLPLPITTFTAEHDTLVTPAQAPYWQQHTVLPLRSYVHPGGHFSVLKQPPPLLGDLAAELGTHLATPHQP